MASRDLRAAAPQRQFLERVLERQAGLRGVPPSRQQRGDGLTPGNLHAEAIEAQCLRPIGLRMRLVPESVASLTGAAASAEARQRLHTRDWARARHATVKTELLTVVDLPKCLLLLSGVNSTQRV